MIKELKDFEDYYLIDDIGNIYSKPNKTHKNTILMKQRYSRDGYKVVSLWNGEKFKLCKVHRLVAKTFIPNPNDYPVINHKDENKENNSIDNLEWCSFEYNNNYGSHQKKCASSRINHKSFSKKVLQLDEDDNIIASFDSSREVERQLGYKSSNIRIACLNNKIRYKYKWKYAD